MIAKFWSRGMAIDDMRDAQILCHPDPPQVSISNDGGRTWNEMYNLEQFVERWPQAIYTTHRVNRRRAGMNEWIMIVEPAPTPTLPDRLSQPKPATKPAPARKEPDTMDIAKLYPDKYLKAEHLNGKSIRATISKVTIEELRNPRKEEEKTRKAVLHFAKSQKILPLNKTQAYDLASITGSTDTDAWPGFVVVLSPGRARNNMATIVISAPPQEKPPQPEPAAPPPAGPAENDEEEDDYDEDPVTAGDHR